MKKIALASFFGVIIFISKVFPTPIDKMLVIVQALLLSLASLLLRRMGATYTAAIGGILTSIWKAGFFPFSLIFAVIYGLMIDGFFYIFKVRTPREEVRTGRLVASLTLSTALIGLVSFYVTVSLKFMPMLPILYIIVLVVGTVSGAVAGYLTSFIWKRYLFHRLR